MEFQLTVVAIKRRLSRRPVGPDGSRSEPLAVHEGDRVLCLDLFREGNEAVAFRLERLRVSNHAAVAAKK